ncbi:sulfur carrier protein ThiS [Rhizobium lemnae]|uniref:Sulfur carrier protein ThiS n=1 Tax=Rhizobium lemnae TaxID=1214924 RepID=A0ABV8E4X0_9HYPH|nr:sulfur carrier protein ThiS [Rhizobium lemnae]MCJ8506585.1 sulfur carrier protein ThiS [Rhizobium lemnae]
MKVIVNGEALVIASTNLADLLQELDYEGEWLATAVNAELIHREERGTLKLKPDDRIEILSPRQGG